MITAKQDWFTKEIEDAGVLVGGGEAIAKKLMLPESQTSFRFAVSPNSTWMHFLTVGFGQHYESTYEEAIFSRLQDLGVSQMFPDLKILFYSDQRPGSFRINFGGKWETVNPPALPSKVQILHPPPGTWHGFSLKHWIYATNHSHFLSLIAIVSGTRVVRNLVPNIG